MKNYLTKNWPLLVLPIALIPFIILIFYILGGGSAPKSEKKELGPTKGKVAINYHLPDADHSIGIIDKMEAIQAQSQSFPPQDYHINADNEPSNQRTATDSISELDELSSESSRKDIPSIASTQDSLMEHVHKQEAQVKEVLGRTDGDTSTRTNDKVGISTIHAGTVDNAPKWQTNLKTPIDSSGHTSTEMKEIDVLLDRSLSLSRQNDSLSLRLQVATDREQQRAAEEQHHYRIEKNTKNSLPHGKKNDCEEPTTGTIRAEIFETETVLTGNRVKIRLLEDTRLNGRFIARNTFVYGICRTENERLQIDVQQLQTGGQFMAVNITVCDLDGLPGLYVPDNTQRKISKEVGSGVSTSSMVGFMSNPIAYAGVQAADRATKSVLQVIKQKKVTIKKNTLIYLINKSK
jgi:conjugative transposon TraM protein